MSYLKPVLKRILKDPSMISEASALKKDRSILEYLQEHGIEKERVVRQMESYYGISYVDLNTIEMDLDILEIFDLKMLRMEGILPYKFKNNTYYFAISDLITQTIRENIRLYCQQRGLKAEFSFAFTHEINEKFNEIEEKMKTRPLQKKEVRVETKTTGNDEENDAGAIELVNQFIEKGIRAGASDIHIEHLENALQVRYRIDGMLALKEQYNFNPSFVSNIIARIKVISSMDIAEKRRPQDGRVTNFIVDGNKYDLRVSSVPTQFGEKIVMRIFNNDLSVLGFDKLGFSDEDVAKVKKILHSPFGIIYLAGPTGSGKTTTLYTMIQEINKDTINIYTIEDPIEKTLVNVNQIQVDPQAGVDFATILRALLRQDPDVIVVGETRDKETVDLAVRASLTGHLVLTTIHANTALETLTRLMDMDIEPYLISASTLGFMSQRLVRVLCPYCKKQKPLQEYEKAWISQLKEEVDTIEVPDAFYHPVGCEKCNHMGYKGRTSLFEIILVSDAIKDLIVKKAPINKIYEKAREEGYVSLRQNGFRKAVSGITSTEEVIRVI